MAAEQLPEGQEESKEFLGLKEFFSLAAKAITTLAGMTACYLLFGYLIVISYASTIRLYGLTPFSQDLYREAAIRFLGNMFETYGRHPFFSTAMVGTITVVCFLFFGKPSEFFSARRQFVSAFVMILTVLTLRLDCIPDTFYFMTDLRTIFLYMVSIPLLVGLLIYLGMNFRKFYMTMYKFYYIVVALFVMLFIAVPVGYGDNIFDIDLFPVVEIECDGAGKIKSIDLLKQAIDGQGAAPFYYLMGHTAEKLILFDNSALSPPAEMIIVDKGMVKYLKVSRHDTNSLRNILREQHYFVMAPQAFSD